MLDRCGMNRLDKRNNLRLCEEHCFEVVKKYYTVLDKNEIHSFPMTFNLPKAFSATSHLSGKQSTMSPNKGISRDRAIKRVLDEVCKSDQGDKSWAMACQHIFEIEAPL